MNFDTLITIAVIIYIIVSIRKAFKAGKKNNTNPPATGWKRKIQDFVNEVKEEIEKANREQQATPSPADRSDEIDVWDNVREEKSVEEAEPPSFWDEVKEKGQVKEKSPAHVISQTLFYETDQERQPPPLHKEPEEEPEESHRNIQKSVPKHEAPLPAKRKKAKKTLCLDKKSLKEAIIWSEILAPPVGLRD